MAIQVSGTTVIDDSRNLVSVIGLKTVGGTAILGSGDIAVGGSTTFDAVGTYTWGRPANDTQYVGGDTATSVVPVASTGAVPRWTGYYGWEYSIQGSALSGTWRSMSGAAGDASFYGGTGWTGLWVRIS